jgi:hypothetical protein
MFRIAGGLTRVESTYLRALVMSSSRRERCSNKRTHRCWKKHVIVRQQKACVPLTFFARRRPPAETGTKTETKTKTDRYASELKLINQPAVLNTEERQHPKRRERQGERKSKEKVHTESKASWQIWRIESSTRKEQGCLKNENWVSFARMPFEVQKKER